MDKFAVDLDRVLDEFEQSEASLTPAPEPQASRISHNDHVYLKCHSILPNHNGDHSMPPPTSLPSASVAAPPEVTVPAVSPPDVTNAAPTCQTYSWNATSPAQLGSMPNAGADKSAPPTTSFSPNDGHCATPEQEHASEASEPLMLLDSVELSYDGGKSWSSSANGVPPDPPSINLLDLELPASALPPEGSKLVGESTIKGLAAPLTPLQGNNFEDTKSAADSSSTAVPKATSVGEEKQTTANIGGSPDPSRKGSEVSDVVAENGQVCLFDTKVATTVLPDKVSMSESDAVPKEHLAEPEDEADVGDACAEETEERQAADGESCPAVQENDGGITVSKVTELDTITDAAEAVAVPGSAQVSSCSLTGEATLIAEAASFDDSAINFEPGANISEQELDQLLEEEGAEEEEDSFLPPLSEEEQLLGKVKPFWIPDVDAPVCMLCDVKFTVLKRRHHCRACGKVLCSSCCGHKTQLPCLENREGRVCLPCLTVLQRVAAVERLGGPSPGNPHEYCTRGPPLLQTEAAPPLTVLVPVLRRGPRPDGEAPKQVMFSDGIRPGGDLSEDVDGSLSPLATHRERLSPETNSPNEQVLQERRLVLSDAEGPLPPIALTGGQAKLKLENEADLLALFEDESADPVAFALTRNLHVLVKIVKQECCVKRECWCLSSRGLAAVGQDEVVLLLERLPGEVRLPRDALRLFSTLHGTASRGGAPLGPLGQLPFPEGILGSGDHGGFLLVSPGPQCVKGLPLPRPPWLCALLLQRWELPWARLLPLRLLLRLGSEFQTYPCPLVSVRGRPPVYTEVGHTIMNVLLDFRNFQYMLLCLPGLVVHVEGNRMTVRVPRNRYDALARQLEGNEHVLALAANLSPQADGHLVCVQADEGSYHTKALQAAPGSGPCQCTGASFVVFSGALKGPGEAKCSVVEDGLLVQLSPTAMAALRAALRAMRDWELHVTGSSAAEDSTVAVVWVDDDRRINIGVQSCVDGRSLEGVPSVRLRSPTDHCAKGLLVRWTELFLLCSDSPSWGGCEDPQHAAESLARSFCNALLPHLPLLQPLSPLGLRAQLGSDRVGYEAGARGKPLPAVCQEPLDSALVPLLSNARESLDLEMVFHILYQ
ncbi:zinc finger FYVE domain-containing protein 16 [Ixodes scapularis]